MYTLPVSTCQTPLLYLQYQEKQVVKKSTKERWSKMTTLNTIVCKEHTPNVNAISEVADTEYTFCEMCENNIERYWLEFDGDRLDMWSDWNISK